MGKGEQWRAVATGEPLMRSLQVGVSHEGSGAGLGLLQVSRPVQAEALFLIGAVVPFHKGILFGMMRLTDLDLDAQTGTKAQQGRRKITAGWTAHPAPIA